MSTRIEFQTEHDVGELFGAIREIDYWLKHEVPPQNNQLDYPLTSITMMENKLLPNTSTAAEKLESLAGFTPKLIAALYKVLGHQSFYRTHATKNIQDAVQTLQSYLESEPVSIWLSKKDPAEKSRFVDNIENLRDKVNNPKPPRVSTQNPLSFSDAYERWEQDKEDKANEPQPPPPPAQEQEVSKILGIAKRIAPKSNPITPKKSKQQYLPFDNQGDENAEHKPDKDKPVEGRPR